MGIVVVGGGGGGSGSGGDGTWLGIVHHRIGLLNFCLNLFIWCTDIRSYTLAHTHTHTQNIDLKCCPVQPDFIKVHRFVCLFVFFRCCFWQ